MNYTISGINYNFNLIIEKAFTPSEDLEIFSFYIKATCKITNSFSCINNLNAIVSYFDIEDDDPRLENLIWYGSLSEIEDWASITYDFLSEEYSLYYLERRLNEDREEGEWENK